MLRDLIEVGEVFTFSRLLLLGLSVATCYLISQRYVYGLNRYPGPFIASFTSNWRVVDVWRRETHYSFRRLHDRYGDVIRVAPNVLSFASPDAIADIYGLNKGYTKVRTACLLMINHFDNNKA